MAKLGSTAVVPFALTLLFSVAVSPGTADAQAVFAGVDALETPDDGSTNHDLTTTPIPADFFGPGSDPFNGIIQLEGGNPVVPGTPIDTVVARLQDTSDFTGSAQSVIPIEIVCLSLTSSQPLTVTYNGGQNPEQWDVDVHLSQAQ